MWFLAIGWYNCHTFRPETSLTNIEFQCRFRRRFGFHIKQTNFLMLHLLRWCLLFRKRISNDGQWTLNWNSTKKLQFFELTEYFFCLNRTFPSEVSFMSTSKLFRMSLSWKDVMFLWTCVFWRQIGWSHIVNRYFSARFNTFKSIYRQTHQSIDFKWVENLSNKYYTTIHIILFGREQTLLNDIILSDRSAIELQHRKNTSSC